LLKYFQAGGPIHYSRRLVILAFCIKKKGLRLGILKFWQLPFGGKKKEM